MVVPFEKCLFVSRFLRRHGVEVRTENMIVKFIACSLCMSSQVEFYTELVGIYCLKWLSHFFKYEILPDSSAHDMCHRLPRNCVLATLQAYKWSLLLYIIAVGELKLRGIFHLWIVIGRLSQTETENLKLQESVNVCSQCLPRHIITYFLISDAVSRLLSLRTGLSAYVGEGKSPGITY